MIKSFNDRYTGAVFRRRRVSKLPIDIQRRAQKKLMILNNSTDLNDLRIPQEIIWKSYLEIEPINTAFASTISGVYVLNGLTEMLGEWK